ncbi:MAG TPA: PH domain-containing protein [Gammaproteobacteria bacterium]|jgi:hypothetical protein
MRDELAFNSKVDLWLLILVLTAVAACLWGVAQIWDADSTALWLLAPLLAVGILLPLWILGTLKYFLSDDTLRVRCGPFGWQIPVGDIKSVTPTNESRSSPAMSLDRLLIEYGDDQRLLISPEPREEFLRQLEHRRKQAS